MLQLGELARRPMAGARRIAGAPQRATLRRRLPNTHALGSTRSPEIRRRYAGGPCRIRLARRELCFRALLSTTRAGASSDGRAARKPQAGQTGEAKPAAWAPQYQRMQHLTHGLVSSRNARAARRNRDGQPDDVAHSSERRSSLVMACGDERAACARALRPTLASRETESVAASGATSVGRPNATRPSDGRRRSSGRV